MSITRVGASFQVHNGFCKKGYARRIRWAVYECECGVRFLMRTQSENRSESCGCLTLKALKEGKHNQGRKPKHGKTGDKVYCVWSNIIQRCTNEKNKHFKNYGGRGITVCRAWRESFIEFHKAVGNPPSSSHTIDRIDNEKGYEPGNVQWVTRKANQRNRRNTKYVFSNGERVPLTKACEDLGVSSDLVRNRLVWGWSFEEAVKVPKYGKRLEYRG